MSYTALSHVSTGELATAALHNTLLDNVAFIETGGIAIASQAALDFLYASSSTQFGRLAKGSALQSIRLNSGASAYEFFTPASASPISLLKAGSGTSTAAGATVVDSVAIASSQLTALDSILVLFNFTSVTQNTARVVVRTDSSNVLAYLTNNVAITAGDFNAGFAVVKQSQASSTTIHSTNVNVFGPNQNQAGAINGGTIGITAAWTASWTLQLQHNGVTAGGTFKYAWGAFLVAGQ